MTAVANVLGSLFLLLALLPLAAFTSAKVATRFTPEINVNAPLWGSVAVFGAKTVYCAWKLAQAGALSARALWDTGICYDQRTLRRGELSTLLGNKYFDFAFRVCRSSEHRYWTADFESGNEAC